MKPGTLFQALVSNPVCIRKIGQSGGPGKEETGCFKPSTGSDRAIKAPCSLFPLPYSLYFLQLRLSQVA
jgi:hypothetical protein